jgi:uncharacterized membrane protein HdeD (DUF308 family)
MPLRTRHGGVMEAAMIDQQILTNWWGLVLRGLAAVLFGVLTMVVPGLSLAALVYLFGAYSIVEGAINVASAFRARQGQSRWWVLLVEGLVSVVAGVIAFVWPGITALALVVVIAIWALLTGILEVVAAVRLRKQVRGEWLLALGGILSIALGVLLLVNPAAGALAMILWIGAYELLFGLLLILLGVRVLAAKHGPPHTPAFPGQLSR